MWFWTFILNLFTGGSRRAEPDFDAELEQEMLDEEDDDDDDDDVPGR